MGLHFFFAQHTRVLQQLLSRAERISQLTENYILIPDEQFEACFMQKCQIFSSTTSEILIFSAFLCHIILKGRRFCTFGFNISPRAWGNCDFLLIISSQLTQKSGQVDQL